VKLSMKKQINKLITDFEKEYGCLDNKVSSPGNRQLFNIRMDAEQLNKKRSNDFHSITADFTLFDETGKARDRDINFVSNEKGI